jgi:serine/threonine protein kinase
MAHANPTYICRYHTTMQPTTKSDVYSFGVVLLEVITGRLAILHDPEPISIIQWTRQRLACGNIEGVVDPSMHGDHDVNSVWKVADIALKCTTMASTQRPTMADVVVQLQECLELEESRTDHGNLSSNFYASGSNDPYSSYSQNNIDGQSTDISQNGAFEVDHNFGRVPTMPAGPYTR